MLSQNKKKFFMKFLKLLLPLIFCSLLHTSAEHARIIKTDIIAKIYEKID